MYTRRKHIDGSATPLPDTVSPPVATAPRCTTCHACCCRLEVILLTDTGVPEHFIDVNEWGYELWRGSMMAGARLLIATQCFALFTIVARRYAAISRWVVMNASWSGKSTCRAADQIAQARIGTAGRHLQSGATQRLMLSAKQTPQCAPDIRSMSVTRLR